MLTLQTQNRMYVSRFWIFWKKGCKHIYTIAHDMSFVNDIWLWTVCEIMTRFKRREKGHFGVVSRIAICPFVDEINTFVRNRIYIMLQFDNSISIRCNKINLPLNSRHIISFFTILLNFGLFFSLSLSHKTYPFTLYKLHSTHLRYKNKN